jgi:Arabinose efflux permease
MAFITVMGMALYDTCTDGLALDTTALDEEGIIQGFMGGGRAAGMVVVSSLLGLIVQNTSWRLGFYFLALVSLLPLPFVFFAREIQRTPEKTFDWGAFSSFKKPSVISLGILGALYSLIIYGANQIVNPSLVQKFSINYSTAGFISTVLSLGIVLGSVFGGRITDKIGQKRSVQTALVISMISVALLAAIIAPWMAWVLIFIFGLAFGFYETVFFAISMRVTDGRIAATMFSILMAIANIGTGIGLGVTGVMSDALGFNVTFLVLAVLNLATLPLIRIIFPEKQ